MKIGQLKVPSLPGCQKNLHELLVLHCFQAASGVNKPPSGVEQGRQPPKQLQLFFAAAVDIRRLQPPLGIGPPPQYPGVRTGSIEENGVEAAGLPLRRQGVIPVDRFDGVGCGGNCLIQRFAQSVKPWSGAVGGVEVSLFQLCQNP